MNIAAAVFHAKIGQLTVEHLSENHELALYTHQQMLDFFGEAGLTVSHDPEGIFGRGLYIARPG